MMWNEIECSTPDLAVFGVDGKAMPTSTVENYVKQLYLEQQLVPGQLVLLGRLAAAVNVVPGTATTMVRTLADAGLVVYEPRAGCQLTASGEKLALHVLRRHRLVELFLVQFLGFDWSEVHVEAEELEHVISEKVLDRIDKLLNFPSVDPHGDPIPDRRGRISQDVLVAMNTCQTGQVRRVARVDSRDAEFLRYIDAVGLRPGVAVKVEKLDVIGGTLTVRPEGAKRCSLSMSAAAKVLVGGED